MQEQQKENLEIEMQKIFHLKLLKIYEKAIYKDNAEKTVYLKYDKSNIAWTFYSVSVVSLIIWVVLFLFINIETPTILLFGTIQFFVFLLLISLLLKFNFKEEVKLETYSPNIKEKLSARCDSKADAKLLYDFFESNRSFEEDYGANFLIKYLESIDYKGSK